MRHPIEKPSEQIMRFFTPELYIQFNSSNEDEADRADEAWETAIRKYRSHLDGLRDRMPTPVRRLAELCLHDTELLACDQEVEPFLANPSEPMAPGPLWSAAAVLSLKQEGEILSLIYPLWDRIRQYPSKDGWPLSNLRKHWLYDEIDVSPSPRGMFLHRVLFSDGSVMEIPFTSVMIHRLSMPAAEESLAKAHAVLP